MRPFSLRPFPIVILCAGLGLPALADTQLRAVTLSTAGLALIEAQARLDSDGLVLPVRRTDIDDFLKSLRLSGGHGCPHADTVWPGRV